MSTLRTALPALALALGGLAFGQDARSKPEAEAKLLCEQAAKKRGKEAVALYEQAIALDANCVEAFVGRGAARRYTEPALALADFAHADAIKDEFQPAASWYRILVLFDVYLDRAGAWDEAERLKRRSRGAWSFVGGGVQELLAGHGDRAEEYFDKAHQNDDTIPFTLRFKALSQADYGNVLSRDTAAQAVKSDPEDPGSAATLAFAANLDDAASASRELDRILGETPKFAWTLLAKARVCVKQSKWDDALAACRAADALAPAGPETAYLRTLALEGSGKTAEAEAAASQAVAWDANYPEALLRRADLRLKLKDWSGALRDYESWKRFAIDPQMQKMLQDKITLAENGKARDEGVIVSFTGYCDRARIYIEEEDWDRAAKDLEMAKGLEEKNERWRQLWILFHAKKKDYAKMWESVQQVIDNGGNGVMVFFNRGGDGAKVFEALKKETVFLEGLRKVTTKTPRDQYFKAQAFYDQAMAMVADKKSGFEPLLRESAAEYRKLCETYKEAQEVAGSFYNEACCWSLANDVDKAFDALERAIEAGYGKDEGEIPHMEKNDTDLANMRKDGRWEALVKKVKGKYGK